MSAEDLILTKTAGFVGRGYIFDAVESFMAAHDRGVSLIEGDPGAGKTAILAEYIRKTHCIGHFNLRAQGLNTPRHFVDSLSMQMAKLFGTSLSWAGSTDAEAVDRILGELRGRLPEEAPMVLAVDALDEAAGTTGEANPLYLPSMPGKGVYFLVSTRRSETPRAADRQGPSPTADS